MTTTKTLACEAGCHLEANFGAILWRSSRDPPFAFRLGCHDNGDDNDDNDDDHDDDDNDHHHCGERSLADPKSGDYSQLSP